MLKSAGRLSRELFISTCAPGGNPSKDLAERFFETEKSKVNKSVE